MVVTFSNSQLRRLRDPQNQQKSTEHLSECCNKEPFKKQKKFPTKSDELYYWQIQYFKGEVETQERELRM
ncbi:hypothetical protein DPMN_090952 [Dreissena polymorpha]|uniref:Uncharacterized protein n=1 Tax=Dreissena polymorpha TaxID=45954 RepID=A0A9D4KZL1_DREPO|nr:hypothetical protein DPMN_090952 [Dreissena polymorpha]